MTIPNDEAERKRRMDQADRFTAGKKAQAPPAQAPFPAKKDPAAKKEER